MDVVASATVPVPPARVLHVVSSMNRGGAETMVMNYYRRFDRAAIQFDFLVHSEQPAHFDSEIAALGGRILRIASPGTQGPLSYARTAARAIREHGPYNAVHVHMDAPGALACVAARLAGVPRVLAHSHNTAPRRVRMRRTVPLEDWILKRVIARAATHFCSCGDAAAGYLFGPAERRRKPVHIIPNAVDLSLFERAWSEPRECIRGALGIEPSVLAIGQVASLIPVKNQQFSLHVARRLKDDGVPARLFFVGEGPLRPELQDTADQLGISDGIEFLGVRSDIPRLLRAFDAVMLPSLFEGLPLSIIEAQAAGLPCVISDAVTAEVDLGLGLVDRLSLEAGAGVWAARLRDVAAGWRPESMDEVRPALVGRGFDASANLGMLKSLYGIGGTAQPTGWC